MNKAFVTGGSGFVGRNLIRRLRQEGVAVAALARSESAANTVAAQGAVPVRGDLSDPASMQLGMIGCEAVFHAAATVEDWGPPERFWQINVKGTENALEAARVAGVGCFVHVGTEAVYATGHSRLVNLNESMPLPDKPLPRYPLTKAEAERRVLATNSGQMRCISVRPRLGWGRDDTSVLPKILAQVEAGKFVWVDQGQALTSTCHVDNLCEGLWLAALKGRGGEAYFVSDGAPLRYADFLGRQMRAHGHDVPQKSLPLWLASGFARAVEWLWTLLPMAGAPPVHRLIIELGAKSVTVDDSKARNELGYRPITTLADELPS